MKENIYEIQYANDAKKSIAKYKKSNPAAFKKLEKLIDELHDHPRTGTGHPEPLVGSHDITYSRRITAKDRLIYDIYDDKVVVIILSVESHYNDK